MRKGIIVLISSIFLMIPLVKAIDEDAINITGTHISVNPRSYNVGEEVEIKFSIDFMGLKSGMDVKTGIEYLVYELNFDDQILIPISINVDGYNSEIARVDGKYYGVSIADGKGNCGEGVLHCDNYSVVLKFFINKTEEVLTKVSIGGGVILITDLEADESLEFSGEIGEEVEININPVMEEITVPEVNISSSLPQPDANNNVTKKTTPTVQSLNTNLKSLTVEGYNLEFDKKQHQYNLSLTEEVNNLKVSCQTEHEKAKCKIIGAEDLRANEDKVVIEVTAEDQSSSKYTIDIIREVQKEQAPEVSESSPKKDIKEKIKENLKKGNKKTLLYGGIMLGCLVLLILVLIINRICKNRAMNKMLDKF